MAANDHQIGGAHYKKHTIQPWDAISDWGLGFLDGNVVKYIARWRNKDGLNDLMKARHYLDKLIEDLGKEAAAKDIPILTEVAK